MALEIDQARMLVALVLRERWELAQIDEDGPPAVGEAVPEQGVPQESGVDPCAYLLDAVALDVQGEQVARRELAAASAAAGPKLTEKLLDFQTCNSPVLVLVCRCDVKRSSPHASPPGPDDFSGTEGPSP